MSEFVAGSASRSGNDGCVCDLTFLPSPFIDYLINTNGALLFHWDFSKGHDQENSSLIFFFVSFFILLQMLSAAVDIPSDHALLWFF